MSILTFVLTGNLYSLYEKYKIAKRKKLFNKELLEIRQKKADAIKEEELKKRLKKIEEQTRKLREQSILKKRKQEEFAKCEEERKKTIAKKKEESRRAKLYKVDYQSYKNILSNNNISVLYHFTDRGNLDSIKKHGALFSWEYCLNNNIKVPYPGGDELSHSLDRRYNLENHIRLSFTPSHPMMFIAMNQNRINHPVVLEINPEVIYWKNTKYADKNATRNDSNIGSRVNDFRRIRFEIARQNNHFNLDESNKPYFQAEVLVLEKIPMRYINNINLI